MSEGDVSEVPVVQGPYFDELDIGQVFDTAPAVTLTDGAAAVHRSILGDRLALPLDRALSAEVTGVASLAHPGLVWDTAIGQSTVVTHHVRANLFYRGLVFRRVPALGDTLRTATRVVALRQNRPQQGRAATGLAALRITTTDQAGVPVLDFWRCAMLPLRDPQGRTNRSDDMASVGVAAGQDDLAAPVRDWRLDRLPVGAGPGFADLEVGQRWEVGGGDVVSQAPELARLTLNVAKVHHDRAAAGGERLVYGGHTIGLALSQACRALPAIATITGWHGCDHVGPVHEGDTVRSVVTVERTDPLPGGHGGLAHLRSRAYADGAREVLDWRFVAAMP